MAIYHLNAKTIGRNQGRSATGAAAYRAGVRIEDARTGLVFDFTRKRGVDGSEILTPDGSVPERAALWNTIEKAEKRSDAQLAREIEVALPRELAPEQMRELVRAFVRDQFTSVGMIADVAFHHLTGDNPHAHIMLTMRERQGDGFGLKRRDWNDHALCGQWRERWAHHANRALEEAGHAVRVDHRALSEQAAAAANKGRYAEAIALDRFPTIHERGSATAQQHNNDVRKVNEDRVAEWKAIETAVSIEARLMLATSDTPPSSEAAEPATYKAASVAPIHTRTDAQASRWRFLDSQVKAIDVWLRRNAGEDTQRLAARDEAALAMALARARRDTWLTIHPKPFWPWRWAKWWRQRATIQAALDSARRAAAHADRRAAPEAITAWRRAYADQQTIRATHLAARRLIASTPNERTEARQDRSAQRRAAERALATTWLHLPEPQPDRQIPASRPKPRMR
jgi:hypothetical protein